MLSRYATLCLAGALYIDWKDMPDEYMWYVVGCATVLAIFDIIMDAVCRS